jgi:hypothetical protein
LVSTGLGERSRTTLAELAALTGPMLGPGMVAQVTGSMGALLAVAAGGIGPEDWAVAAGLPNMGLLAGAQLGLPLGRTVVVPDLGHQPLRVVAALIDAYGLVLLGDTPLAGQDRRRLEARLRHRQSRLVTTGPWAGAGLTVAVERCHQAPLGGGDGHLADTLLDVVVTARQGFATRLDAAQLDAANMTAATGPSVGRMSHG